MKTTSVILSFLTVFVGAIAFAGGPERERPSAVFMQDLKPVRPAPLNRPLQVPRVSTHPKAPISAIPPLGHGILARVLENGSPLKGDHSYRGNVTATSANWIQFTRATIFRRIDIRFAFPEEIHLREVSNAPGRLDVSDSRSPAGGSQSITVWADEQLFAYFTWQNSKVPISFQVSADTKLVQDDSAQVWIRKLTGPQQRVPAGEPLRFEAKGRDYVVYVQSSTRTRAQYLRGIDHTNNGYVLRAVVLTL